MTDAPAPETPPERYGELTVGRRRWQKWVWVPVVLALLLVGLWWATHPSALPHDDTEVTVTAKAGQTAYVGVLGREADDDRRIHIRDVTFETSGEELDLEALICRDGSISTTTRAETFCAEVVDAEGSFGLGGDDQLIVAISADRAVSATVEEIEVTYRQGLQFGTDPVGPRIVVQFGE